MTPTTTFTPFATSECPQQDLGSILPIYTGGTLGDVNAVGGATCGGGGGSTPDATYRWTAPASGAYSISLWSDNSMILSVRSGDCLGDELVCSFGSSSAPIVTLDAGQSIIVVVDGQSTEWYELVIFAAEPTATPTETPPPTLTPTPTPTVGGCCVANSATGCANPASCNTCVCALDSYCCYVQWDGRCASEAGGACTASCSCTVPTPAAGSTPTPTSSAPCPQVDLGNALPLSRSGTTVGQANSITDASCGDGGYRAPDAEYLWTAPADGTYIINASVSFPAILSVRDGSCVGVELFCTADLNIEVPATVSVTLAANQSIVIAVDGTGGYSGSFGFSIEAAPPTPTSTDTPAPPDTPTPTETPTVTPSPTDAPTPTPRSVIIQVPTNGSFLNSTPVQVTGQVIGADAVTVNGFTAAVTGTTFTASLDLVEGSNTITASATSGSDTVQVTLDTIPPAAPVVRLIGINAGSGGMVTVVGLPGSVEANGVVTVTNTRTAESVTANADDAGAFTATLTAQPGDTLSFFVTDRAGNVGPPATKQVSGLTVLITQPSAGATVAGDRGDVRGTLVSTPNGTVGVTVNGVPALVENGQFVTRVSIDASLTSLTAVARDFTGVLSVVTIPVAAQPVPEPPVRLTATRPAGLVPVTTAFRLSSLVGAHVQQVALDADGDGTADFQGTSFNETFTFTYTHPGIYTPQITVTDTNGNVYTATAIVQVSDPVAMDARLQPVWQGEKASLRRGDVPAASQFLHSETRTTYMTVWNELPLATLADIDQVMTEIQLLEVGAAGAKYDMRRDKNGQTYSFNVWFQLDGDGLWRLRRF